MKPQISRQRGTSEENLYNGLGMDLGWLDVCLRVSSVEVSRGFYEGLGFHRAEGSDAEGWAVMVNGESRIGLYEQQHMGEDAMMLNFRGGDVMKNAEELIRSGYVFYKGPTAGEKGGGSAFLKDPDGYVIFMDAMQGETKRV